MRIVDTGSWNYVTVIPLFRYRIRQAFLQDGPRKLKSHIFFFSFDDNKGLTREFKRCKILLRILSVRRIDLHMEG
jgi:hypothetical protein